MEAASPRADDCFAIALGWPGQARPGRPLAFSAIGMSIPSPQPRAFPRISKLFQGNSKEIPSFSKLFQGFPNFFPWPFRGKSRGYRLGQPGIAFSPNFRGVSAATREWPAAPCRTCCGSGSVNLPSSERNCRRRFPRGASGVMRDYAITAIAATAAWCGLHPSGGTRYSVRRLMPLVYPTPP